MPETPSCIRKLAYEWTYGAVYSPKWIKGLTVSADWWHIDMRDIVVDARRAVPYQQQFTSICRNLWTLQPVRLQYYSGANLGPVTLVIDPNQNLSGAIFEGLDYEAIYILDSTIFGDGDLGRLTTTVNGTWLSRAELQPVPVPSVSVSLANSYRHHSP